MAGLRPDLETVTLVSSGDTKPPSPHEGLEELSVHVGSSPTVTGVRIQAGLTCLEGAAGIKRHSQEEHLYLKFLPFILFFK